MSRGSGATATPQAEWGRREVRKGYQNQKGGDFWERERMMGVAAQGNLTGRELSK